jgi:5-methylcytosine-specific restriction enzyme subunit McrC
MTVFELVEYEPRQFFPGQVSVEAGELLWRYYQPQVAVEFPSPKTAGRWQLTGQGWAGYIPVTPELAFSLQPRVTLSNLFGMLEYAYQLKSFHFLPGLMDCHSLAEFYERLALVLARRILDRGRRGFYQAYLAQTEPLAYLRGRVDLRRAGQAPAQVKLTCHYEEKTADVADNQILAWTLWRIARSGLATERTLPTVRRAYRALLGLVTLTPHDPQACLGRSYHRLNEDYRALHALCRFFLEQSGPGHQAGERTMVPFLVNMARLYEAFVAEWLKANLPDNLALETQARVNISDNDDLHFEIDLVLAETGNPQAVRWVLDTKYKIAAASSTADIAQVLAYAQARHCREAILVYPVALARPIDTRIGDIRLRSLTFALDGNLAEAGRRFLQDLLETAQSG